VLSAGGLPLFDGDGIVGAIGVSGGPSGDQDRECADAGAEVLSTSRIQRKDA
jgi:uncharacterized protein GlcG (DUF336 family)